MRKDYMAVPALRATARQGPLWAVVSVAAASSVPGLDRGLGAGERERIFVAHEVFLMATLPIPFPAKGGRPRKKVDPSKIIALRAKGVSWRQIAKRLHIGTGTAFRAAYQRSKSVP